MMLICVLCVVLVAGSFPTTRANTDKNQKIIPLSRLPVARMENANWEPEKKTYYNTEEEDKKPMYKMNVSFLYEVDKHGNSWFNEKKIRKTVKLMNKNFQFLMLRVRTRIEIEEIHPFTISGKSLAKYNAYDLYKLLKKDSLFKKINPKTATIQILATGAPGQGQRIAVSTFQTICSTKSRGVIIERKKDLSHVSKLLAYNLACSAGIYNRNKCHLGFAEEDMACEIDTFSSAFDYLSSHYFDESEHCYLGKLGWSSDKNYNNTKKLCVRNRSTRLTKTAEKLQMKDDNEEEDDESGWENTMYIILAVVGVLVTLAAMGGIWLWKINRYKTKMLTKKRVSVKYKYDPMTRNDRPSIITDPTVTNDLE